MKLILLGSVLVAMVATLPTAWAQNRPPQGRPAQQQPQAPAQPAPAPAPTPAPAPQAEAPVIPPQNQARVTGWAARCVAGARTAVPECVVEQGMALVATGQTVMGVVIRITPDTRAPVLQVQLPHGTLLPAGVRLRTETGVGIDLAFQMCDQRGCFTGSPVSPEFLAALKKDKRLDASVQNMARETQLFTMPLDGFVAAYERVQ